MASSDSFLIEGKSFSINLENYNLERNAFTAIPQTEINEAGDYWNADSNTITYANINDLNFGPNYLTKLGASDNWIATANTNSAIKDTIKKASGKSSPNIKKDTEATLVGNLGFLPNTNANRRSTIGKFIGRYPINESRKIKFDYLKVDALEHIPNQLSAATAKAGFRDIDEEARKGSIKGTVFLPMIGGLQEQSGVDWGQDSLNALQIAGAKVAGGTIGAAAGGEGFKGISEAFMKSLTGEARNLLQNSGLNTDDIAGYFAGEAVGANIFTRTTGKTLNPNLELLFKGPRLRTFNYSFKFTPREEREAKMVKKIIKFFKKEMAPRRTASKLFLETPNVFKLKYIFKNGGQHPYLNKIKTCALQSFDVQYNPSGQYMTYEDGSMTEYQVTMSFGEINPIYRHDYEFSNDTNDMGF